MPGNEKVVGQVCEVNDDGIKIADSWYNFSKFRQIQRPFEGDEVEIEIKDRWIQTLHITRRIDGTYVDKQLKITRSGLLNTAVQILRTNGNALSVEEVIETARKLEPYICETCRPTHNDSEDIPF